MLRHSEEEANGAARSRKRNREDEAAEVLEAGQDDEQATASVAVDVHIVSDTTPLTEVLAPKRQFEDLSEQERAYRISAHGAQRSHFLDARKEAQTLFDQSILTVSGGLLGLSVTFIQNVVHLSTAVYLERLYASWVLFIAAILSTMISFMTSKEAYTGHLDYTDRYFFDCDDEYANKTHPLTTVTKGLNWTTAVCFILALVLTISFVIPNVSHQREIMSNEEAKRNMRPASDGSEPAAQAKVPNFGTKQTTKNQTGQNKAGTTTNKTKQ